MSSACSHAVRLTEHQLAFLRRVQEGYGYGCVHRAQCRGPCKAGNRLVERGLLIVLCEFPRTYRLTDAGRCLLASASGDQNG